MKDKEKVEPLAELKGPRLDSSFGEIAGSNSVSGMPSTINLVAQPTEVSASPEPLPCRTPGAVYHFKSAFHGESGRHIITLHIYMPQEIGISEEQAEIIENKLHDASESILSGYWPCNFAAQPVSAKVEEAVRQCAELVVTKPPLSNELIVKLYEQNVANMTERFIAILRPFFTPVSQPPDVKCKNCDLKLTQKVLWLDYMGVEVCQPHISQKLHEPIAAPVTPVRHGPIYGQDFVTNLNRNRDAETRKELKDAATPEIAPGEENKNV